jgi:hypothetical protein
MIERILVTKIFFFEAYFGCYLSGLNNYDLFSTSLTTTMIVNAGLILCCGPYPTGANLARNYQMTNEMCISFCLSNGFIYSGTIQK